MIVPFLRKPGDLVAAGLVAPDDVSALDAVTARYAMALTPQLARTRALVRQFVPTVDELVTRDDELADPIGDHEHSPVPGIVHRHPDRVLFKAVAACPVYCRFCFRRETIGPGSENALSLDEMDAAYRYIANHREISEVILTGGDPFILSARRASEITHRLAAIEHVKIVRWHTRVPVVDPARVTDDLVAALMAPGITTWIALHANHSDEFSPDACRAIARLIDAGIPMVSQSVLLNDVNNSVDALDDLMRAFVANRVKPYYLHHPDRAPGTAHFRVTIAEGRALMRALRARLSGLAMPSYVLDIPGGHAKVSLLSDDVEDLGGGHWRVRDHAGVWHDYRD
jgi:lysine 2,3-aminomutase